VRVFYGRSVTSIEFRRVDVTSGASRHRTIEPYVGGRSLIDLVKRVELPAATKAGEPTLAGAYHGLRHTPKIAWPSRHYLGEPVLSWFDDGDTVLLGCVCGDWGCRPLTARVTVRGDRVGWDDFRQGHRSWSYDDLGPFWFHLQDYETALRGTAIDQHG
jgi:hypothetical protein